HRAGQQKEALACLKKSDTKQGASPGHNAFVFAMIYHRLGDVDESRRYYKRGLEGHKAVTPKDPDAASAVIPPHWSYGNVLEEEATRVLNAGKSAPRGKASSAK